MLLELSAPLPTIRPGARTPLTYPQINSPPHLDPARNLDARLRTVVGQLQAKNPDSARNPPIGFHSVSDKWSLANAARKVEFKLFTHYPYFSLPEDRPNHLSERPCMTGLEVSW